MSNNLGLKEIKIILSFMKPYKIIFFSLFLCVTVISFISMLYPYLLGMMINEMLYHRNIDFFIVTGSIYLALFIGERLIHFIQSNIWTYLSTKFLFDIRKTMFDRVITSKAHILSDIKTGNLIWLINNDTSMFMDLIHMNIFNMFNTFIRFLLSVLLVFSISYKLAILMFLVVPTAIYISMYFSRKAQAAYNEYRSKNGQFISWVFEILNGIREVQLVAGERNVTWYFVKKMSELIRIKIGTSYVELASERAIALISMISDLCIYVVSGILIINGNLTVGGFVASVEYFNKANISLKNLNEANVRIRNDMVSIVRVFNVLNMETERAKSKLPSINIVNGKIEYKDISFSYNDQDFILEGLNLQIEPGEKIAIVGKSGAGKSTLVSLLTGLYRPNEGSILIDDTDISACSLNSLRKHIGIVQQDVLLFDGTIRYNLSLAKSSCIDVEIWEACKKAYAADFISNLPNGLDTIIGRSGVNLSGGQRQRIAIARIILKSPKILVFDEATSALDYEAEKAIQKAWDELSKGRTSIIIAHRLTTILNSDRVAVLQDGKIIACDNHLKLMKSCEHYMQLFYEQYFGAGESAV